MKVLSRNDIIANKPNGVTINGLDLVIIMRNGKSSVLYGRCLHRGALMADGHLVGENLVCGLHGWDYRWDTGVSEYNNNERLYKFYSWWEDDVLHVDEEEINEFLERNPQPFKKDDYLGKFADTHPEATEPYTEYIKELAHNGLSNYGHHGPSEAMGVDRDTLPKWEGLQFLPAQLSRKPLLDDAEVNTRVVIGSKAKKPLHLEMPIFISDMSFGALSREAKIALAKGAERAKTGICSGEGGMLPEEQANNSRYFYELASGKFGFSWDKLKNIQAFHFKGGQGAKTGTGGHLPGSKVTSEIAAVRGLKIGEPAISPATFPDLHSVEDFKAFAEKIRKITGGVPIGFKIAASHIEDDLDFAISVGVDYIILDGRGGGTGSAPSVLRININIPTIPALARARKHLDNQGQKDISLVITGGLRVAEDFAKAMMLGADAIAISNSALQAIGCLGMRACHTDNCPVGIATQKENLRSRLIIDQSAKHLEQFLKSSNSLIKVIARSCGYPDIKHFNSHDLSTFDYKMHQLTGVQYAGIY